MRINIIDKLACPLCLGNLLLVNYSACKTNERIMKGKLKCTQCNKIFSIKNGIVYFISQSKSQKCDIAQKEKIILEQEISKSWLRHFSEEELTALKQEWKWMLSFVKKDKSSIHLDFATGTGRFLRNIISKTKGEIIALDFDYSACQELAFFLKRIKKYKRVSIVCANACQMPFKNSVFDSVSSWHGLDEPGIKKAITEVKRVLKVGGYFTASGINYPKGSKSFLRAKKIGLSFLTEEEVRSFMKKIRFRKVKYMIFFRGHWKEKEDYLPIFNDEYSVYGISAKK